MTRRLGGTLRREIRTWLATPTITVSDFIENPRELARAVALRPWLAPRAFRRVMRLVKAST
jgi:hypothetical protein